MFPYRPLLVAVPMFAAGLSVLAQDSATQAPPEPSGMMSLFNGKGLEGWNGDPRLWKVQDGVIHGETTDENRAEGNTFLIWDGGPVKDFELRLSFRCSATNNSGIQYRSRHVQEGVRNKWVVRGYQHELRNENDFPNVAGFIYDEGGKRGRMCMVGEQVIWGDDGKQIVKNFMDQEEFKKIFRLDDWNDVIIQAQGKRIRHYMNGRLIVDFTDEEPRLSLAEGILALQLHAGKPMWAEFKNIRLKKN
jgi:hypothetical protein